ncbi:uncharacterized protein BXZ73DRAFT_38242 [Epithele typhae]|uniref:uncharacterized protein n=1 Tax=Epithele typhae TaxID=378194 RepID=UPI0020088845|nr:uncharacterized protein BXZ73DRAFT_38242 [Epithele typhae]KAH9945070.1 hypothetical protein BXZ73DRAFT_38242 [Epithele typhae]
MDATLAPAVFTPGSLYIAGFTQARAPHLALIIPKDNKFGDLVHIRIDRAISDNWKFQHRIQKISGDMFLSSLLRIHDISAGPLTVEQLRDAASTVVVPDHGEFGACSAWVLQVVDELHKRGFVQLSDTAGLAAEIDAFATGSKAYARRDRFPNVAASQYCS